MKLIQIFKSKRAGKILGFCAIISMLAYGVTAKTSHNRVINIGANHSLGWVKADGVQAKASLSQNKVFQGSDGEVYLQVDLEALKKLEKIDKTHKPTDFVIVLDRSGSMSGSKKMDYAKKAIRTLVNQLTSEDRFSLVTFDSIVETPVELVKVTSKNKADILEKLESISPRGSTNLGSGMIAGQSILKNSKRGSVKKLIILSDGNTNAGITDPKKLNQIAAKAVNDEMVMSTIGVGLDFNENLLASLADFGTGSYYFLEKLSKLDDVLAREFYGSSHILAKNLQLKLKLFDGAKITDASGYPITNKNGYAIIQPGHLYYGQKKSFFVTMKLPTDKVFSESFGTAKLSYNLEEKEHALDLIAKNLVVGCVKSEKEAVASVDKDVYSNAWSQNNYGQALKEGAGYVKTGNKALAKKTIAKFKKKLQKAYELAPSPEMKSKIEKLDDFAQDVETADSDEDQKRLSKQLHYKGGEEQRKK